MSTVPPPPKLKAYLANIKEKFLSDDSKKAITTKSKNSIINQAYEAILLSELIQRGVILPISDVGGNDDGNDCTISTKLLESIRSTAGRPLLNESSSPTLLKPLLAGASAIAGMVVERCYDTSCSMNKEDEHDNDAPLSELSSNFKNNKEWKDVFNRCKEVTDERFQILLQLPFLIDAEERQRTAHQPPDSNNTDGDQNLSNLQWKLRLLHLAEGYYTRAASFQPDTPQMWKRSLDVIEHRKNLLLSVLDTNNISNADNNNNSNSNDCDGDDLLEASVPLTNLIRIAESKGNDKRVSELSLRLAESYLHSVNDTKDDGKKNTVSSSSVEKKIHQIFVCPFYQQQQDDTMSLEDRCNNSRYALEKCDVKLLLVGDDTDDDYLLVQRRYNIITYRIESTKEMSSIEQLSNELYETAKNRSISSKSIDTCRKLARKEILIKCCCNRNKNDDDLIDKQAIVLRDSIVSLITAPSSSAKNKKDDGTSDSSSLLYRKNNSAMNLIRKHIERLQDKACAVMSAATALSSQSKSSKTKIAKTCSKDDVNYCWSNVSTFISPITTSLEAEIQAIGWSTNDNNIDKDSSKERENILTKFLTSLPLSSTFRMIESVALAETSSAWMTGSLNGVHDIILTLNVLSSSINIMNNVSSTSDVEDDKGTVGVVKSSNNTVNNRDIIECAHATAKCLVGISQLQGNSSSKPSSSSSYYDNELINNVTEQAIVMSKHPERYNKVETKFGMSYLQLVYIWSGLHRGPWSFCNVIQARLIVRRATDCLERCKSEYGRITTTIENFLLDTSFADAEGGLLAGGFIRDAIPLFENTYKLIAARDGGNNDISCNTLFILKSHCFNGLSRIALRGGGNYISLSRDNDVQNTAESVGSKNESELAEHFARESLKELDRVKKDNDDKLLAPCYLWTSESASESSFLFHLNSARQLVADALLRASRINDAQSFLEDAVRDAPLDYDAAFALGSFRLRLAISSSSVEQEKAAQRQLLKAAKLDSTKSDPFALLGIWYEKLGDMKRALGCYSKALLLDPPHPVAGRGILRLKPFNDVKKICDDASNTNSPTNGWAWRAIGQSKAMVEADDELAIICFQKAIRCRDIECPINETLGPFYSITNESSLNSHELGDVWAELAGCYRRLGRFSASVRAFHSAKEAAGNMLSPSILCSWAQVELELGLYEEAAEKFAAVLERSDKTCHQQAAYGQGYSLMSIAQTDLQDGKGSASFKHLRLAIDGLLKTLVTSEGESLSSRFFCALKLLGDLYSFGASLPPYVFEEEGEKDHSKTSSESLVRSQITFVGNGEAAFRSATETAIQERNNELHVASVCDLGTNILLQAQLLSSLHGEGSGLGNDDSVFHVIRRTPEVATMFDRSAQTFKSAIDVDALYSPAWCGLGCAVYGTDPLLSQHAFCRALQLDKTSADAWSNSGFLYATHNSRDASELMMDALTQVADTPMMWIGRALLLERMVFEATNAKDQKPGQAEAMISSASDAYRAALQVMKHPSALQGLSLACRIAPHGRPDQNDQYSISAEEISRRESRGYMSEFTDMRGRVFTGPSILQGLCTVEDGVKKFAEDDNTCGNDLVVEGTAIIRDGLNRFESVAHGQGNSVDKDKMKEPICNGLVLGQVKEISSQRNLLSLTGDAQMEEEQTLPFPYALDVSRQLVHDPANGEHWLRFAKSLAKDLIDVTSHVDSFQKHKKLIRSSLEASSLAAERAAKFLTLQLSDPTYMTPCRRSRHLPAARDGETKNEALASSISQPAVPKIVDARDVSEALALSFWLEKLGHQLANEERSLTEKKQFDLQRALIMCPNNTFARKALAM